MCACTSRFHTLPQLNSNGISEIRAIFAVLKLLNRRHYGRCCCCCCCYYRRCRCVSSSVPLSRHSKIGLYIVLLHSFSFCRIRFSVSGLVNCFFMTVTTKITTAAAANTSGIWDGVKSEQKNPFESFYTLFEEENVWPRHGKPEKGVQRERWRGRKRR